MDNSINFKGAFWLKQPVGKVKNAMTKKLGQQPIVFENFTKYGDVLYVTSKSADRNIAKVLMYNKVKFRYYPHLSKKSGFKENLYNEAMIILNNYKSKVITNIEDLERIFKLKNVKSVFSTRKRDNTIEKCLNTLKLNKEDYIIERLDGYNEIYTKNSDEKKLVALISEPGQYGWRYVRLEPQTPDGEIKRYAIRADQKFSYINSPDETIENGTSAFLKKYYESVNMNRKVTHTSAHQ